MRKNIQRAFERCKKEYDKINVELIESNEFGSDFKIYYPPKLVECTNCLPTQYGVIHRSGGPMPFTLGDCPWCGSDSGQKEHEHTETIRAKLYPSTGGFAKNFYSKIHQSLEVVDGEFLGIFLLSDIEKIRSANYAVIYDKTSTTIGEIKVTLASEPMPHGVGRDKFFFCFWKRT